MMREHTIFQLKRKKRTEKKKAQAYSLTHNGKVYAPYTSLNSKESAITTVTGTQKTVIFLLFAALVTALFFSWHTTVIALIAYLTVFYTFDIAVNMFLLLKSISDFPEISISQEDIIHRNLSVWPSYTILCPLYKEHAFHMSR